MKIPLVVDQEDPKWRLLGELLKCFGSRRFHQEMSKAKVRPVPKGVNVIQVTMIALFFSEDLSYVVSELKKREETREFLHIEYVPDAAYISRFLSRFTEKQFLQLNLSTRQEFPIATASYDEWWPAISGDIVVWISRRNMSEILCIYILSKDYEDRLYTESVSSSRPAIYGNTIVWRSFCCYIYGYSISGSRSITIDAESFPVSHPAIHGDIVVWEDFNKDIHCYRLSTRERIPLAITQSKKEGPPAIFQDMVVWRDYRNGNWDIYGYHISELLEAQPPPEPSLNEFLKGLKFTHSEVLCIALGIIAIVTILVQRWREGKKESFPMMGDVKR